MAPFSATMPSLRRAATAPRRQRAATPPPPPLPGRRRTSAASEFPYWAWRALLGAPLEAPYVTTMAGARKERPHGWARQAAPLRLRRGGAPGGGGGAGGRAPRLESVGAG